MTMERCARLNALVKQAEAVDAAGLNKAQALGSAPSGKLVKHVFCDITREVFTQAYNAFFDCPQGPLSQNDLEQQAELLLALHRGTVAVVSHDLQDVAKAQTEHLLAGWRRRGTSMIALAAILCKAPGPDGKEIVKRNSSFLAAQVKERNRASAAITPAHALAAIRDTNRDLTKERLQTLSDMTDSFYATYNELMTEYLYSETPASLDALVIKVKAQCKQLMDMAASDFSSLRQHLLQIMAGVCTSWSVNGSKQSYKEEKDKEVVITPHPVQVLAILRLLGADQPLSFWSRWLWKKPSDKLMQGHVVEVGTGAQE